MAGAESQVVRLAAHPVGHRPSIMAHPARVGMLAFLLSEVAFFGTLITTYAYYLPQIRAGSPSPAEVFRLPLVLVSTACLLSSSVTAHFAERALRQGHRPRFLLLWGTTILLGALFLAGTAHEWDDLIGQGLTISRGLFGTCYYTLVGFHAAHVTVGVVMMSILLGLALRRQVTDANPTGVEVVSWYWHFVDGVWVVVLTLVYLVGR